MKILIVRFSSIGDIVLTTPVVRCLKQQCREANIHYATKYAYRSIIESNPYIDAVHLLKDDWASFVQDIRKEKFDWVIDLHHNLRTARLKWALRTKSRSYYKANFPKWLLTNFKMNRLPDKHIVDRYMETVSILGVKNDGAGLDCFIPPEDHVDLAEISLQRESFIAFSIGGQYATKKLPVEKISAICNQLQKPVVLLGGKEDLPASESICKQVDQNKVINMCGKCSIHQSASIIDQSALVISHDTGMMHIASALKKEVISIWGNTIPQFGMYPYQTKHYVVEVNNLPCRPCSKIGYDACPESHFRCMEDQSVREIVQRANQ